MSAFWEKLALSELERIDSWLDVEPALCAQCGQYGRTVLLGVCASCVPPTSTD